MMHGQKNIRRLSILLTHFQFVTHRANTVRVHYTQLADDVSGHTSNWSLFCELSGTYNVATISSSQVQHRYTLLSPGT